MSVARLPLFHVQGGHLARNVAARKWEPITKNADEAYKILRAAQPPDELVYFWDVDGVNAGAANHDFYQKLERQGLPMWIDAGCRNPDDAMDAFFAGAEVLTIRLERMSQADLRDFADLAEGEFHLSIRLPGTHPEAPLTAGDVKDLVGELHANGAIIEVEPTTDRQAAVKFAKLVVSGGIDTTLLSPMPVPWLDEVAAASGATRVVRPEKLA